MREAPRRTLKVASVVGRVFEAPDPARRLPRAGHRSSRSSTHLVELRAADLVTLDREARPGLPVQARRDPGGRLREPARSPSGRGSTGGSGRTSSGPTRTAIDRQPGPPRPPLLAERRRRPEADVPGAGRRRRPDRLRQRRRRSTIYDRLVPLLEGTDRVDDACSSWRRSSRSSASSAGPSPSRPRPGPSPSSSATRSRSPGPTRRWPRRRSARAGSRTATARLDAALAPVPRGSASDAGVGDMLHLAGVDRPAPGRLRRCARTRYEDSRAVREEIGELAGVATTDGNLAILAEFDGDYPARARAQRPRPGAAAADRRPARDRDRRDERRLLPDPERRRSRARGATSRRRSGCRASSATGRWSPTRRSPSATPSATSASTGLPRRGTPRRSSSSATSTTGSRSRSSSRTSASCSPGPARRSAGSSCSAAPRRSATRSGRRGRRPSIGAGRALRRRPRVPRCRMAEAAIARGRGCGKSPRRVEEQYRRG